MNKIFIAKLGKTVGLKGQQKLHIDSDFPEQFKKDTNFTTDKNQKLVIETYNHNSGIVKFIGIDTLESAKKLTNRQLFVTEDDTRDKCQLTKKEFFWFDIMGSIVKENNVCLGKIIDIQRMPLSDYFLIETSAELVKQKLSNSFLLPYEDNYIISVDIDKKIVTIKNGIDILRAS